MPQHSCLSQCGLCLPTMPSTFSSQFPSGSTIPSTWTWPVACLPLSLPPYLPPLQFSYLFLYHYLTNLALCIHCTHTHLPFYTFAHTWQAAASLCLDMAGSIQITRQGDLAFLPPLSSPSFFTLAAFRCFFLPSPFSMALEDRTGTDRDRQVFGWTG